MIGMKSTESDLFSYNCTRKREAEKRKIKLEERLKKNQSGKTNNRFYELSFTLLRFSFYTLLYGHPIWSHKTESYAVPNFPKSWFKEFLCLLIWIASSASLE